MSEFTTKQLAEFLRMGAEEAKNEDWPKGVAQFTAAARILARIPDPGELPEELVREAMKAGVGCWLKRDEAEPIIRATIAYITGAKP